MQFVFSTVCFKSPKAVFTDTVLIIPSAPGRTAVFLLIFHRIGGVFSSLMTMSLPDSTVAAGLQRLVLDANGAKNVPVNVGSFDSYSSGSMEWLIVRHLE